MTAATVEGRGRVERGHERMLATVFGPVTVRRLAYRTPGRPNVYPADVALSLPAGRHSHRLRRATVRGSYNTAKTALDRRCGHVAAKRRVEYLVQAAADTDAFYTRRVPMPGRGAGGAQRGRQGDHDAARRTAVGYPQGRRGQVAGPGPVPHPRAGI